MPNPNKENSKLLIIAALSIVLIGGSLIGVFVINSAQQQPNVTDEQPIANQGAQNSGQQDPIKQGTYQDYSTNNFEASAAKHKLLFFYASWCPQCHSIEKSIQQNGVPNDIAVFKIDYDTATDLKAKYGVTLQTTIVQVNDKGDLIKKFVAYEQPNITAVLQAFGLN